MSTFQLASRRVFVPVARRNVVQSVSRRTMMAFEDHARLRGKVEEDLYMNQQAKNWSEHLKEVRAKEESDRRLNYYENVIEPAKRDVADLLAKTGDSVSDKGLENLAMARLKR